MKNRLQYLKDNIDKPDRDLSFEMDVSLEMVKAMREQNGLTKDVWYEMTPEQQALMMELYPSADWQEIYDAFPMYSHVQIRSRARALGLYRD